MPTAITNIELKQKIKDLAVRIKQLKSTRKQCQIGFVSGLENARIEFRLHHIAASLLRGRTFEQIEQPAPDNCINMSYVKSIMDSIVFVKKNREEEGVI